MTKSILKSVGQAVITAVFLVLISAVATKEAFAQLFHDKINFILNDTELKPFRLSEQRGKILVFSFIPDMDNKKTASYWLAESRKWLQEINQKFGNRITIIGLKEMTDLPMFLPKSVVRAKLRKEPFPYLIDWEGKVFERFSVDETFTLMVLDTNGNIAYRISEPFSSEKYKDVCLEIEKLIQAKLKRKDETNSKNKNDN